MRLPSATLPDEAPSRFPRSVEPVPREYLSIVAVKDRERITLVHLDDVAWIETAGNYVRLHAGGRTHLHRTALTTLQQRLDPRRFVRIHRTAIVNLDRIAHLERSPRREYDVVLHDGTRLTLTPSYRTAFEEIVGEL